MGLQFAWISIDLICDEKKRGVKTMDIYIISKVVLFQKDIESEESPE